LFGRWYTGLACTIGVVETKLVITTSSLCVLASDIRITCIGGTVVSVVAVGRRVRTCAINTNILCACVKVIAIDRVNLTTTKLNVARLRITQIGVWAGLVVTLAAIAQVECARIVVVTVLN